MSCLLFHHWGRWVEYEEQGSTKLAFQSEWSPYTETRQKRQCQRCGKIQDERVKLGPLAAVLPESPQPVH